MFPKRARLAVQELQIPHPGGRSGSRELGTDNRLGLRFAKTAKTAKQVPGEVSAVAVFVSVSRPSKFGSLILSRRFEATSTVELELLLTVWAMIINFQ
jgi:hypothetical protein